MNVYLYFVLIAVVTWSFLMHSLHDVLQATNNFDTEQIKDLILLFYHKFKGGKYTFFSLSLTLLLQLWRWEFRSGQQYLTNGVIYVHFKALLPISYSPFDTLYIYICICGRCRQYSPTRVLNAMMRGI